MAGPKLNLTRRTSVSVLVAGSPRAVSPTTPLLPKPIAPHKRGSIHGHNATVCIDDKPFALGACSDRSLPNIEPRSRKLHADRPNVWVTWRGRPNLQSIDAHFRAIHELRAESLGVTVFDDRVDAEVATGRTDRAFGGKRVKPNLQAPRG